MPHELRTFLEKLKAEQNPEPSAALIPISSARKCLETACRKLGFPQYTHHDFRHFFATTCIESGVDIPTVSRWLGHSDGGRWRCGFMVIFKSSTVWQWASA